MESLSLIAMLLSLVPVGMILFRRAWQSDNMNFLMVLCLLTFFQHLLGSMSPLSDPARIAIRAVFGLGEFVILLYLLRPVAGQKWVRDLFYMFAIAFLSVVITIYAIKGTAAAASTVGILEAIILIIAAVSGLVRLLRSDQVFIFRLPICWIIAGTLAYFSMYLLLESLQQKDPRVPLQDQQEKMVLLTVINGIRSIFFIIAAWAGSYQLEAESQPMK